jgi:chemotaxis signal transduction protein
MTNLTKSQSSSLTPKKNERSLKLLIFGMGNLNLALPIDYVKKVIHHIPIYSSGTNHFGVVHLEDREVTVIDLHRKIFKTRQAYKSIDKSYLILTRNTAQEQFGIVVDRTPSLIEVPVSQIRVLPESYRRSDTLEIASHITIIPEKDNSLTVFLLDVDRLI